ncbi:MAG TPA: phospholipase D-like domain-containing protein [Thermohalobaculum sp.]|nr:phospholipase D-like domain-containing protein [Thermohalobaculum sp.]
MPQDVPDNDRSAALPVRERLRLGLETVLGIPFTSGNAIEAFRNGDEIFPPMLEAIAAAEHRVEFLTFVYWTGDVAEKFVEALSERARAGVEVMTMLDGFGARPMSAELLERMEEAGVEVRWFRPIPRLHVWQTDNRTHRKVLICDGVVGFTGGVGIASEWEGDAQDPKHWRDTHFRIRGPAVMGLRGAFYEDWMERELSVGPALARLTDPGRPGSVEMQVIPASASVGRSPIASLHDALIGLAERRIRIATAYFSPTSDTTERLLEARARGVEVDILIPGPYNDKRVSELAGSEDIGALIEGGVRFWRYQPTMYHNKLLTVDGELASIGSANFNHRSVAKDDEIAVNVLDPDFTGLMDRHFEEDLERSERIGEGEWEDRGLIRRALEFGSRQGESET